VLGAVEGDQNPVVQALEGVKHAPGHCRLIPVAQTPDSHRVLGICMKS
jgi:hypothetical protein